MQLPALLIRCLLYGVGSVLGRGLDLQSCQVALCVACTSSSFHLHCEWRTTSVLVSCVQNKPSKLYTSTVALYTHWWLQIHINI